MGFDARGNIKLFDFGLAREMDPGYTPGETYLMTAFTGSLRYMAPEVALGIPYNLSSDIYSFGILFWQICALEIPFSGFTMKLHKEMVVDGNSRPEISSVWPNECASVLAACWKKDCFARPSSDEVSQRLVKECIPMSKDVPKKGRRSIFTFSWTLPDPPGEEF